MPDDKPKLEYARPPKAERSSLADLILVTFGLMFALFLMAWLAAMVAVHVVSH